MKAVLLTLCLVLCTVLLPRPAAASESLPWDRGTLVTDGPGLYAQVVTGEPQVVELAHQLHSYGLWFESPDQLEQREVKARRAGVEWVAWDFEAFPLSGITSPWNEHPVAAIRQVIQRAHADGFKLLLQVGNNWRLTWRPFTWENAASVLHAARHADLVMVQWMSWECAPHPAFPSKLAQLRWFRDHVEPAPWVVAETQLDEAGLGWGGCDIDDNLALLRRVGAIGAWSWWTKNRKGQ
jgi:hypothetical protein